VLIYSPDGKAFIPKNVFKEMWCSATGRRDLYPRIERLRSHRGGIYYATKYLCKEQEEELTDEHKKFSGRFWGVIGRKNRVTHSTKYRLSPDEYKQLHGELCVQLATKRVKYELRKEGNEWEQINAVIDSGIYEEKIMNLAKQMITKNKAPTKMLTDDKKWLEKIQSLLSQDSERVFDDMYNQL